MVRAVLALCLIQVACGLDDQLVRCGDLACPVGMVCTSGGCATFEQAAACEGLAAGAACSASGREGTCTGGACHPVACGNGVIDASEVCDDGNVLSGDGCAADCYSDETCGNDIIDGVVGEQCDSGIYGLSNDGCTSRCTIEFDSWREVTGTVPPTRVGLSLVTDLDGHVLLFGGRDQSSLELLNDAWSWDGIGWLSSADPIGAPSPRRSAAIAHDIERGRIVVFGGIDPQDAPLADTWEWTGRVWIEHHPATSPPPRMFAAMTYDATSKRVLLFGGTANNIAQADTWTWDGTTWSQLSPPVSPPARSRAALVHDPKRGVTVLMAGSAADTLADTWEWDGATWTERSVGTPSAATPLAVYDAAAETILATTLTQTWEYDGQMWTQRTGATAPSGAFNGMAFDKRRGRAVYYKGNVAASAETWEWDGNAWTQITAVLLHPGFARTAAYDSARGLALLWGSGMWGWNGRGWRRFEAPGVTNTGLSPTMEYDELRDEVILFNGSSSETWRWKNFAWTKLAPATQPPSREGAAMTYDARAQMVVLFGGYSGGNSTNTRADLWAWDGTTWIERTDTNAPPPRSGASLAYDKRRGRLVLRGGSGGTVMLGDTWESDGTQWVQLQPPTSPSASSYGPLVYDPQRAAVLYVGAGTAGTWQWDGVTWTRVALLDTPTRRGLVVTTDVTGGVLAFATSDPSGNYVYETWRLRFESAVVSPERCLFATEDSDSDGFAGCMDPDCWRRCAPSCPPETLLCDPTTPRCGDGVCSMIEDRELCPADCS